MNLSTDKKEARVGLRPEVPCIVWWINGVNGATVHHMQPLQPTWANRICGSPSKCFFGYSTLTQPPNHPHPGNPVSNLRNRLLLERHNLEITRSFQGIPTAWSPAASRNVSWNLRDWDEGKEITSIAKGNAWVIYVVTLYMSFGKGRSKRIRQDILLH